MEKILVIGILVIVGLPVLLMVLGIVGGALFMTVNDVSECSKDFEQIDGESLKIDEFGATDSLDIKFTNAGRSELVIKEVSILKEGESVASSTSQHSLGVGDDSVVSFDSIGSSEECNSYQLKVIYQVSGVEDSSKAAISGDFAPK